MDVSDRAVPMNIDSNGAQLTMADCLYLVEVQQVLTDKQAGTQSFLAGLPDRSLAMSYNPNLDFYVGSATPYVSPSDAIYCINYVVKRWRFVYNTSLTCSLAGRWSPSSLRVARWAVLTRQSSTWRRRRQALL